MSKLLESQARAQQKYRDKTRNVAVTFNIQDEEEAAMLEHLEKMCEEQGTKKASYIKKLIALDMKLEK